MHDSGSSWLESFFCIRQCGALLILHSIYQKKKLVLFFHILLMELKLTAPKFLINLLYQKVTLIFTARRVTKCACSIFVCKLSELIMYHISIISSTYVYNIIEPYICINKYYLLYEYVEGLVTWNLLFSSYCVCICEFSAQIVLYINMCNDLIFFYDNRKNKLHSNKSLLSHYEFQLFAFLIRGVIYNMYMCVCYFILRYYIGDV